MSKILILTENQFVKCKQFYKSNILLEMDDYDIAERYVDEKRAAYELFVDAWNAKNPKLGQQKWRVIDANLLLNVWRGKAFHGYIKNDKPLFQMKRLIIQNTAKLAVNTELVGHSNFDPLDELNDIYELNITNEDEYIDFTMEFVEINGHDAFSDYGIDKLERIMFKLIPEQDPEKLLVLIDQALNVYHQRNDLASFFVEGGTSTLDKLSA